MIIDKFEDKYRFLSNFAPSTIILDGLLFPTVEHAYQALKCVEKSDFERIRKATSPGHAKSLGRKVQMVPNWDDIKYNLMFNLVHQKFAKDPLLSMLLATGDAELVEGNYWNDTYWGVCRGIGQNNLGKILMQVRKDLKFLHETSVV
jgi:ribA/ribD-fused uncharacterized protein